MGLAAANITNHQARWERLVLIWEGGGRIGWGLHVCAEGHGGWGLSGIGSCHCEEVREVIQPSEKGACAGEAWGGGYDWVVFYVRADVHF